MSTLFIVNTKTDQLSASVSSRIVSYMSQTQTGGSLARNLQILGIQSVDQHYFKL